MYIAMYAYTQELPRAEIYFHHGETTNIVSFEEEVRGAPALVPHVDRIGHGAACSHKQQSSRGVFTPQKSVEIAKAS
jgi:hypothetical protein